MLCHTQQASWLGSVGISLVDIDFGVEGGGQNDFKAPPTEGLVSKYIGLLIREARAEDDEANNSG